VPFRAQTRTVRVPPHAPVQDGVSIARVSTVAVVGLGGMGSRMARRLLQAGHEVFVWNRTPERAAALVEAGAIQAESLADVARSAEAVITIVSDPAALSAVVEGPNGIAAHADASVTVIEMSTVGPGAIKRLSSLLPEETGLLDAPVLGSLSEAEDGALKIFVGGPKPLVNEWTPLLSALGDPLHVGPLGAGSAAKMVANSTLFGVLVTLGEALALAQGLGLARDVTFDLLATTPVAAQAERRRAAIESGEYPRRFALSLGVKDLDLIAKAAAGAGVDLRVATAARAWLAEAEAAGWGDRDYSAVLAWILGSR
jgi:3-hydroxyisobutyrate dehydrogenase-like beta-hydroxyacid dehydrogenase